MIDCKIPVMPDQARISLEQIAQQVGVSRMTVSRALRGHPNVSEALGQKIRDVARAMGYVQDAKISRLMGDFRQSRATSYRETIAFVATKISSWCALQLSGVETVARKLNYSLDLLDLWQEKMKGRDVTRILAARGIRGLILAPPTGTGLGRPPHYTLDWKKFSTIILGSSLANRRLPRVQLDHFESCKTILRQLHHRGYRRIGLLLDRKLHERSNRQHLAAFRTWNRNDSKDSDKLVHFFDHELEEKSFRKWLTRSGADCLVAHSDDWLEYLQSFGCEIPKEMGFAVFATTRPNLVAGLELSSRIGEEAMYLLDTQLRAKISGLQDEPLTIMVPPSWRSGKTAPSRS